jgi:hypothetical protein
MKFLMHMTEEEVKSIMSEAVRKEVEPLKKELAYLTEQRDQEFLKIEAVALKLQVTDRTVRNWVRAKKLQCYWLGDRQFFLMKDIIARMQTNL